MREHIVEQPRSLPADTIAGDDFLAARGGTARLLHVAARSVEDLPRLACTACDLELGDRMR